ncbi:MAG: type II toxin-antitoxin system VapC family toxin [Magnetococcales bacterium]|nr:type II toxin-antitoxin system VapC family toxin [Magnetococcales bacterium]
MTLVDTNLLLDIVTDDPVWADWSIRHLEMCAAEGSIIINDVVYAELSVRFDRIETLDHMLDASGITLAAMPRPALFLAGKIFQRYRAAGGTRNGVLPDFFIGAHAVVAGLPLLTRDIRRYRTYFPTIRLIAPQS